MATQSTEYGKRSGHNHCIFSWPVGASEVFKKAGGAFVTIDASGRAEIAVAGDVDIIGFALFQEDFTASSIEGATRVPVDMSYDSVYEVPIITGTWADTMRGKLVDLVVSSNVQGVDLTASGEDCIQLIDKGTTNAAGTVVSVLCRLHPRTLVPDGVV
jgi:hypothetical protein